MTSCVIPAAGMKELVFVHPHKREAILDEEVHHHVLYLEQKEESEGCPDAYLHALAPFYHYVIHRLLPQVLAPIWEART